MTNSSRLCVPSAPLLAVSTTGCASILSKTSYPVTVDSSPSQADFVVKDRKGNVVAQGTTPQTVTLPAKQGFFRRGNYHVEFDKPGYVVQTKPLKGKLDEWYLGNIIFGGALGMLIVDPATGAMWELPKTFNAELASVPSTSDIQQASHSEISEPEPVDLY